ncbi:MAG: hypothetical protein ACYCZF_16620, partial [Anaerolineae bacterium]
GVENDMVRAKHSQDKMRNIIEYLLRMLRPYNSTSIPLASPSPFCGVRWLATAFTAQSLPS